jgi:hypothetical protein
MLYTADIPHQSYRKAGGELGKVQYTQPMQIRTMKLVRRTLFFSSGFPFERHKIKLVSTVIEKLMVRGVSSLFYAKVQKNRK